MTSIPIVLLVGPTIGYYLGTALEARWSFAPWGMIVGLILGGAASVKGLLQMLRQAGLWNRHD
ncbi:MAG: AtpZ/AtpI family protein [Candidatus Omnitrophota bacterium]|nr:AtpZ/AtpI family protein [Candidatus Omnitrophota bacterium]